MAVYTPGLNSDGWLQCRQAPPGRDVALLTLEAASRPKRTGGGLAHSLLSTLPPTPTPCPSAFLFLLGPGFPVMLRFFLQRAATVASLFHSAVADFSIEPRPDVPFSLCSRRLFLLCRALSVRLFLQSPVLLPHPWHHAAPCWPFFGLGDEYGG